MFSSLLQMSLSFQDPEDSGKSSAQRHILSESLHLKMACSPHRKKSRAHSPLRDHALGLLQARGNHHNQNHIHRAHGHCLHDVVEQMVTCKPVAKGLSRHHSHPAALQTTPTTESDEENCSPNDAMKSNKQHASPHLRRAISEVTACTSKVISARICASFECSFAFEYSLHMAVTQS